MEPTMTLDEIHITCAELAKIGQKPSCQFVTEYDKTIHSGVYEISLLVCYLLKASEALEKEMSMLERQMKGMPLGYENKINISNKKEIIAHQLDALTSDIAARLSEHLLLEGIVPFVQYAPLKNWQFTGLLREDLDIVQERKSLEVARLRKELCQSKHH